MQSTHKLILMTQAGLTLLMRCDHCGCSCPWQMKRREGTGSRGLAIPCPINECSECSRQLTIGTLADVKTALWACLGIRRRPRLYSGQEGGTRSLLLTPQTVCNLACLVLPNVLVVGLGEMSETSDVQLSQLNSMRSLVCFFLQ